MWEEQKEEKGPEQTAAKPRNHRLIKGETEEFHASAAVDASGRDRPVQKPVET